MCALSLMQEHELAGGSSAYNEATKQASLVKEVRASFWNHATIVEAFESGRAADLSQAPKVRTKPILLLGSGPSLNEALPLLRHWEGDIICTQSQAASCVCHGKDPTYIVAFDPNASMAHLDADAWEGRDCSLVCHPGVRHDLVAGWPGQMYLYRKSTPNVAFYTNSQAVGYSWEFDGRIHLMILTILLTFASSVPAQAFIAHMLGYSPIFLVGADFGYPGGVSRFTRSGYHDGEWQPFDVPALPQDLVEADNGCPTDRIQLFYKRNMISAWRLDRSNIINCSTSGALGDDIFPSADVREVISRQGRGSRGLTWKEIVRRSELYLAQHGSFVVWYNGGIKFVESHDPLKEIPGHLARVQAAGAAVDIRKNMKRIGKLVATAERIRKNREGEKLPALVG